MLYLLEVLSALKNLCRNTWTIPTTELPWSTLGAVNAIQRDDRGVRCECGGPAWQSVCWHQTGASGTNWRVYATPLLGSDTG